MAKRETSEDGVNPAKVPIKIVVAVTISILPVLGWPFYMMNFDFEKGSQYLVLACLFPIYVILCGYLAYKCYLVRREITFILLILMWLSYGAAFLL